MSRAVVYLRVSSTEQIENTSMATQEKVCREYCARKENDMEVVRVFTDAGESAKTADRPEFKKMLKFCTEPHNRIDYVVAHRVDRLARNNFDYAVFSGALAKYGACIRSATEPITDDATGKFMQTVLSAIAELDNTIRGQRARAGMESVMLAGGWAHLPPSGYSSGRNAEGLPILLVNEQEAPLIRTMFELAASRMHTLTTIREAMKDRWKATMGRPLYVQTVQKILTNPTYAGRVCGRITGGRVVEAKFSPLVDGKVFDQVQATLAGKGHVATPHDRKNQHFPLRNFVRCGKCNKPLTGSFATGRNKTRYPYYNCGNPDCRGVNVKKQVLEDAFRALLDGVTLKVSPQLGDFRVRVLDEWRQANALAVIEQATHNKRLTDLERQQEALLDKLIQGVIADDVYAAKTRELTTDIAVCRANVRDADLKEAEVQAALDVADNLLRKIRQLWEGFELVQDKQRFQKLLFPAGLAYTTENGFGTGASSPIVNVMEQGSDEISQVAPPTGFEPVLPG